MEVPNHIAIILDGNRRWAKERGLSKLEGHREGVQNAGRIINAANDLGMKYLTLYIFSSENWNRSVEEVGGLMSLFESYILSKSKKLIEKNIKVKFIGNLSKISPELLKIVRQLEQKSEANTGLNLLVALSYGGREEIVDATKRIAELYKNGGCELGDIDEEFFKNFLYVNVPDPDLFIRTGGGNTRISNFLLWQIAYTELYFIDKYWPDFTEEDLKEAILALQNRERRYGK
jgi:undecaprenyl diphosphate synthase